MEMKKANPFGFAFRILCRRNERMELIVHSYTVGMKVQRLTSTSTP